MNKTEHNDASSSGQAAAQNKPDATHVDHNARGHAFLGQGRLAEAVASYRQAISLKPDYAGAYNNLGNVLQQQEQLTEAIASYRQLIVLKPDDAEAYLNLGNVLQKQGQLAEAVANYRQAIMLNPNSAETHNNLGNALQNQGQLNDAVAIYQKAIALKPDFPEAHNNMGAAHQAQGLLNEAVVSYRQAIALKPDYAVAFNNLLFLLTHDAHLTPEQCLVEHLAFAEQFEQPLRALWQAHANDRNLSRPLKVGFVSGDLRHHAVANFIEPVWAALAPEAVDLWVYSNHPVEDVVTARLRRFVPHWRAVAGLSDEVLANTIRADGIDILIDLSGHTAHNRLLTFARKPAPVQATWIGYPGTTGLSAIDYLICDRFNAPHGLFERYYCEQFARLPSSNSFKPLDSAPAVNALPALSNGYITFASFNHPTKLSETVIAAWSQVLQALPSARLMLSHVDYGAVCRIDIPL